MAYRKIAAWIILVALSPILFVDARLWELWHGYNKLVKWCLRNA